jgi:hypothetical protein
MNRLCTCTGGGSGVALTAALGLVSAMSLSSAAFGQCTQPDSNCQLPDQGGHGETGVVGATSDANPEAGFQVADNMFIDDGGAITSICWWGFYLDFNAQADCSPGPGDTFTVRYYDNVPGFPGAPGTLLAEYTQGVDLTVTKAATGNVIPSGAGDLVEYVYTGTHTAVTVAPAECIWISVQNATDQVECFWLWSTAPSQTEDPPGIGDSVSYQRVHPADPENAWGTENDYDLAWCVNLPLGDPNGCDTPINPGCEGATNDCDTFSPLPGCIDQECCTIVCQTLAFCCSVSWNAQCVAAAAEQCAPPPPEPCAPLTEANCQLPTLQGAGGRTNDAFLGFASDDAADVRIADDFLPTTTGNVTRVCWWGFFIDGNGFDCGGDPPPTAFTISYYLDDGTGIPVEPAFATQAVVATAEVDGVHEQDPDIPDDDITVWKFDATHAPVPVTADQCYFMEIVRTGGDGDCVWFWETAPFNPTGDIAFNYSMADDETGYDYTDATDVEFGWCMDIELGDNSVCTPTTVYNEECDPSGAIVVTQNLTPNVISDGDSVACAAGQIYTTDNSYCRSYDLSANPDTAGKELEAICVRVAVEVNDGSAYPVAVNLYADTDGGVPTAPGTDLNLLGTTTLVMPWNTNLGFLQAVFDPPVTIPADTVLVAEVECPDRDPSLGGDSGGMWIGTGGNGSATTESFLLSASCGLTTYATVSSIGFPAAQLVQEVHLNEPGGNCPWDCQTVPNGQVDISDFLALLAQFGQVGTSCDFDGGGVGVTDFLAFLANFGPCPP